MKPLIRAVCVAALMVVPLTVSASESGEPVRIEFERSSKRIDIATGTELPDYTLAERGSFRFFSARLDTPEDFIRYYHDGPQTARITAIDAMEKFNGRMSQWRVRFNTRNPSPQYIPRVFTLAVSFVPFDAGTKKPARRVYVLLDDLRKITWKEEDGR
jgi:hypothetical protein